LTEIAASHKGPVYLRLARPETPLIKCKMQNLKCRIGGSEVLVEGQDLTVVSCGPVVTEVIKAVKLASCQAEVINAYSVKPLDKMTILQSAAKTGKVLTVEDHSVIGGLGGAVAELLAKEYPLPLRILGVPDVFGESARSWEELLAKYQLDSKGIAEAMRQFLAKV
jgi:transketolase